MMAAAISLSTEFLAPPTRMAPDSGDPARTTMRSTGCQYGRTMATIRATWPAGDPDGSLRAGLLAPRHDIVEEAVAADGSFGCAEGPFRHYRRTVLDAGDHLEEVTTYQLAIPWFAWLFALPIRSVLKHPPAGRQDGPR